MSDNELFWEHVHAALDERRDPLSDERVQALLAEDPTRLDELLTLRERIAQLRAQRPRRSMTKVAAMAAAVLVAGAAAVLVLQGKGGRNTTADAPPVTPSIVNAPVVENTTPEQRSRVISFRAHIVTEQTNSRTTLDFDGEHVVSSREFISRPSDEDSAVSQPAFVASIVHLKP